LNALIAKMQADAAAASSSRRKLQAADEATMTLE